QGQFTGNFAFNQSNGFSVSFPSTGTTASGPATAMPGGNTGFVSGWIEGRQIHFLIRWPWANGGAGATGSYSGTVDDNGFASGSTVDVIDRERASWNSTVPLGCVTPAAPAPQPARPPATPLPGTDQKPNNPVPVTTPPTPLPGTDQKPNNPVPVTTP